MDPSNIILCPCGANCVYTGREEEPCWGKIEVEDFIPLKDESDLLIHACRGHAAFINHGAYNGRYLDNWNIKHLS